MAWFWYKRGKCCSERYARYTCLRHGGKKTRTAWRSEAVAPLSMIPLSPLYNLLSLKIFIESSHVCISQKQILPWSTSSFCLRAFDIFSTNILDFSKDFYHISRTLLFIFLKGLFRLPILTSNSTVIVPSNFVSELKVSFVLFSNFRSNSLNFFPSSLLISSLILPHFLTACPLPLLWDLPYSNVSENLENEMDVSLVVISESDVWWNHEN